MSTENLEIDLRNSQDIKIGAFFLPSDEPQGKSIVGNETSSLDKN
jgi:hypothetical protein